MYLLGCIAPCLKAAPACMTTLRGAAKRHMARQHWMDPLQGLLPCCWPCAAHIRWWQRSVLSCVGSFACTHCKQSASGSLMLSMVPSWWRLDAANARNQHWVQ